MNSPADGHVVFLRARLDDEDEAAAEAALGPPRFGGDNAADEVTDMARLKGCDPVAVAHFEQHAPGSVLLHVEAKRRVIALYEKADYCERLALQNAVLALCAGYSSHPDYDPGWGRLVNDALEATE